MLRPISRGWRKPFQLFVGPRPSKSHYSEGSTDTRVSNTYQKNERLDLKTTHSLAALRTEGICMPKTSRSGYRLLRNATGPVRRQHSEEISVGVSCWLASSQICCAGAQASGQAALAKRPSDMLPGLILDLSRRSPDGIGSDITVLTNSHDSHERGKHTQVVV